MVHSTLLRVLPWALAGLLTGCGDWPWPMDNPDDPLRCEPRCEPPFVCQSGACAYLPCKVDPCHGHGVCTSDPSARTFGCACDVGFAGDRCDECAVGYQGYPSCQVDFCYQQTCNDHGVCTHGRCGCATGFSGDACGHCAEGYVGYPNCVCQCTSGDVACDGRYSIKSCAACWWTSETCAEACRPLNWPAGFCATSPTEQVESCYCASNNSAGAIEFKLTSTCGGSQSIAVYDATSHVAITTVQTLSSSKSFPYSVSCVPGHSVCWGAWETGGYWGCGQNCLQNCEACCQTCPATGTAAKSLYYGTNLVCP